MMNPLPIPLDIPDVQVLDVRIKSGEVHIMVESTLRKGRCQHCGKQLSRCCGHDRERVLRHLPILNRQTFIHIKPKRFECDHCRGRPTTTQPVEWYDDRSSYTRAYEDHLLLQLINSTVKDVALKEDIGYEALLGVLNRRVDKAVNWNSIRRLDAIGVDEIALKKGHNDFATIVTGRVGDEVRILGVLKGREKATVKAFFSSIPKRLRKKVKVMCTDMYEGFVNAAKAVFPKRVKVIIDRFHVARLYRKGLDQLRQKELKRLKKELPEAVYKKLKGALWALRRGLANRTAKDEEVLRELFKYSPALEAAYSLSGILTNIFDRAPSKRSGRWQIRRWTRLVRAIGVECFDGFLKTLDKHMEEILNYFVDGETSGFVEGLNNKIKVIKRRCYGLLNTEHLFQRLSLDLGNYHNLPDMV